MARFTVESSSELVFHLRDLFKNKKLSTESIKAVIDNDIEIKPGCENRFYRDVIGMTGLISNELSYLFLIKIQELIDSYYYEYIKEINYVMHKFRTLENKYDGYNRVMNDLFDMRRGYCYIISLFSNRAMGFIEKKLFTVLKFSVKNEYVILYIMFAMINKGTKNEFNFTY